MKVTLYDAASGLITVHLSAVAVPEIFFFSVSAKQAKYFTEVDMKEHFFPTVVNTCGCKPKQRCTENS